MMIVKTSIMPHSSISMQPAELIGLALRLSIINDAFRIIKEEPQR
jgi:hypothetical protein